MRTIIALLIAFLTLLPSRAPAQAPPGKPLFNDKGPQVGEQLPNPEVRTPEGDPRELHAVLSPRVPTLLVTASFTCPKSRSTHPALLELQKRYAKQINVVILYVIEAHPQTDPCPYTGKEDVTAENVRDRILRRQPTTADGRNKLVAEFKARLNPTADLYVDTMDDHAWRLLGGGPNMAFLVDAGGIVHARQGWLDARPLAAAIDAHLAAAAKHARPRGGNDFAAAQQALTFQGADLDAARKALDADPTLLNWVADAAKGIAGGRSILMHAAAAGRAPMVKLLLDRGADPHFAGDGGTALHLAAAGNRVDVIDLLLAAGAKPDARFARSDAGLPHGPTPLDEALINDHRAAADRLLKAGATPSFFSNVALGRADAVRAALDKDPTRADRPDGRGLTPLIYAAAAGQLESTRLLLEHRATLRRPKDGAQEPPLAWAVKFNRPDVAAALLRAGAPASDMSFQFSEVPLNLALANKELDTAKLLLLNKADPSALNWAGHSPLMWAAQQGDLPLMNALLAAGADVNQLSGQNRMPCGPDWTDDDTALHLAAAAGQAAAVQRLLTAGASVNPANRHKQTPFDVAKTEGVRQLLKAAGAKPSPTSPPAN